MHIYAFGSVCRGEVDCSSDIDVLALVERFESQFDPSIYSIYSYARIEELWGEGNPFAWHLAKESRLLFSSDGRDYIRGLGNPEKYQNAKDDCKKFYILFADAKCALQSKTASPVFEMSTVFLAIRNFASCYALGCLNMFEFSRSSAKRLGDKSLIVSDEAFATLERARILSTRGHGEMLCECSISQVLGEIQAIDNWMHLLLKEI